MNSHLFIRKILFNVICRVKNRFFAAFCQVRKQVASPITNVEDDEKEGEKDTREQVDAFAIFAIPDHPDVVEPRVNGVHKLRTEPAASGSSSSRK